MLRVKVSGLVNQVSEVGYDTVLDCTFILTADR